MKVALVSYDWGEYCIRLASALSQKAQVFLLLAQQLAKPHLSKLDRGVTFQPFHKPRLRQPLKQGITICRHLRAIREFDPKVIHIQQGHFWFNFSLPLLRKYPLVLTIHDPRHHIGDKGAANTPQRLYDFGFRRADQIIVHVKEMANVVIDEISVPRENIHIIPHIVLGDNLEQTECQEVEHMVLFFGRIWKYKGLEYLIKAEPLIKAQVPDAKIVIAGQGENFERYRRMMVNPRNFIVYNEYVSDEKRSQLFKRASVVVLPYIEATQSGVIPLAYSFGKPVIATRVGGLPEQIENGKTGFLVPPRNEKILSNVIVRMLKDKKLRHRLGENGKKKLETEWSAQVVAQKTLQVYRKAIHDGSSMAL